MSVKAGLARLGDPTGKSEMDWVNAMGRKPVAISTQANGMRVLQWRSGRYMIQRVVVVFGPDHRFVRIASRYQC